MASYIASLHWIYDGTIIWTGVTCKKVPCYMHDSACRWYIVKKAKNILKLC